MTRQFEGWREVTEQQLQRWLDTDSPDYIMEHQWGDDLMVCKHRRTREPFAYQSNKDKRCFVHPDFTL